MAEGSQVTFRVVSEPDPAQLDKKNQRGKAADVRLAV
jgi:hypothetical protein